MEKAMATHSSTLAWRIRWTEEPGRLQSTGSLRVRHDWVTSLSLFLSCIGEGNGNPLQCSCLENPRDSRAWWAAINGVAQSRTQLKWVSSSSSYPNILGWCKINCSFPLLNFAIWYWSTFLNKCSYVIHHFNVYIALWVFANDLLFAMYPTIQLNSDIGDSIQIPWPSSTRPSSIRLNTQGILWL